MKARAGKALQVTFRRARAAAADVALWTHENVVDVALVGGYAAIAFGAGLVYLPAGLIVGGLLAAGSAIVLGGADAQPGEPK